MAYSAEINRANPACLIFLLDQSGSMYGDFGGGSNIRKEQAVADAVNRLLAEIILASTGTDGIRDYFHVAVLGYGAAGDQTVSAFSGALSAQDLLPISVIALNPLREEDRKIKMKGDGSLGTVTKTVKMPVWIEPKSVGGTPMAEGLDYVYNLVSNWIQQHPATFPPIVIHITDGAANSDPIPAAQQLMSLASNDGNVLVFNCHISGNNSKPILYPAHESELPDSLAKQLFQMSSVLPPNMAEDFRKEQYHIKPDARGIVFQGDLVEMIQFLNVGTRSVRNLR